MKSISVHTNITSIRSRRDGSLGLSLETPELNPKQKVLFMELQNIECETIFTPLDFKDGSVEIKTSLDNKSPSKRLRDVLFVWYKQDGSTELFDTWYSHKVEQIIDWVKGKLI